MRKLLYFGTGAAIIGIVLLLLAFYASYSIVMNLQNELASNTNVNLVLEDATLEAIFLGIMSALGYALVSQGLGGIRREELLELEGSVEDAMASKQERGKLGGTSRDVASAPKPRKDSVPATKSPGTQAKASSVETTVATSATIPTSAATTALPSSTGSPTTKSAEPARLQSKSAAFSWRTTPVESPTPVAENPEASVITEPAPSAPVTQPATAEVATSSSQAASEKPSDYSSSMPLSAKSESSPPVVWEGGPPPKLEGVEVLPEPPEHGAAPTEGPEDSSAQTSTDDASASQPSPKRGRGRPKGSKNRKSDEQS